MTNLALSAVVIVCLLVPGLVFQAFYYKFQKGADSRGNVEVAALTQLLIALAFSIPTHALWAGGIDLFASLGWISIRVDFGTVFQLMRGGEAKLSDAFLGSLSSRLLAYLSSYLLSQAAFGYVAAFAINKVLDAPFFRKNRALSAEGAVWLRVLTYPEGDPDFLMVSVTLPMASETYLYFGILESYSLTSDGDLRYMVLEGAARRRMGARSRDEETYFLPGERFVLNCRSVETIDVDYFWIDDEAPIENQELSSSKEGSRPNRWGRRLTLSRPRLQPSRRQQGV